MEASESRAITDHASLRNLAVVKLFSHYVNRSVCRPSMAGSSDAVWSLDAFAIGRGPLIHILTCSPEP